MGPTPFQGVAIPVQSSGRNAPAIYRRAVGKLGGCTATAVSPPGAPVTAVLMAAHCPGADTFHVSGGSIGGFTCLSNKFFSERGGSANEDVAICFSKQPFNGSLFGCLDNNLVGEGEQLRSLGYGNPQFNKEPVNTLLSGRMSVTRIQNGKAIISEGGSEHVTPGDSGGPVVRMSDESADPNRTSGSFKIVGVNSKYLNGNMGQGSAFAPFTEENLGFFTRAMERWSREQGMGAQPQICGVNFQPGDSPQPRPRPRPNPPGDPDHRGGTPPGHGRDIDPRTPVETLADILRPTFPRDASSVADFARGLELNKRARLLEVLRLGSGSMDYMRFIARLGTPRPSPAIISMLINAMAGEGDDIRPPRPQPDPVNPGPTDDQAFTDLFKNRSVSLLRSDQAQELIGKLRTLARNRGSNPDAFNAKAARWAASLTAAQRQAASGILAGMNFMSSHAEDNAIKQALVDAIRGRDGGSDSTGQAGRARDFARNWNKTLNEAIEGDNVDLEKQVTAYELGGQSMKVRDWANAIIREHGYDELVRWANSVGGNTGKKTLALLAKLDSSGGENRLAIKPHGGGGFDVDNGSGQKSNVMQPSVLDLGANPSVAIGRMMPSDGDAWEKGEFIRPSTVPSTAPHIQYNGPREPASDEPPAPPRHDGGGTDPQPRPRAQNPHVKVALDKCVACHKAEFVDVGNADEIKATLLAKSATTRAKLIDKMIGKGKKAEPKPFEFSADEIAALKNITAAPPPGATPRGGARVPLDEKDRAAIAKYETGMKYIDGTQREHYPADMFKDVPQGGTGKLILAYFGMKRPDLERIAAENPLVEVRNYPIGSPEHKHAQLFRVSSLGIDGLGRKITRYAMDEVSALRSLMSSEDVPALKAYLDAKAKEKAAAETPPPPPHDEHRPAPPRPREEFSSSFQPSQMGHFVDTNCRKCHESSLPTFLSNWDQFKQKLDANDPTAKEWLKRLNTKVVHGEMLTHAGLSKTEGAGKDFRAFIGQHYNSYIGGRIGTYSSYGSPEASSMIDPAKASVYAEVLRNANITDPELSRDLREFDAIWDTSGNPAWSWAPDDGDSGRVGARPVGITPAGPPRPHLFQQVDGKWKWKEPFNNGFAVDASTQGLKKFTVIRFPRDAAGNLIKGVKGTERRYRVLDPTSSNGYAEPQRTSQLPSIWGSFPAGTKVFEVFYSEALGRAVPVDILQREKRVSADGKSANWAVDAFRQDSSPEKIREWVNRQSDRHTNPDMQAILTALDNPQRDGVRSDLGADGSGGTPFVVAGRRTNTIPGSKSVLSGVSANTLTRMYTELTMDSSAGSRGWQLEPNGMFRGSHRGIPMNGKTCANCHKQAGESFQNIFANAGLDTSSVALYGQGPGYDGVLSAPWFSRAALAMYEQNRYTMEMRPEWGKFFETYDQSRHSTRQYRRTTDWESSDQPLVRK